MVDRDPDNPEPPCVGRQSFRLPLRCWQAKVEPPSRTTTVFCLTAGTEYGKHRWSTVFRC